MWQSRTKQSTTGRTYLAIGSLTADHIRLIEDIEFCAYTITAELSRYFGQYFREGAGIAGATAGVGSSFTAVWACF